MNYHEIFNKYSQGDIRFFLLNKSIIFPDDKTLDIYGRKYVQGDTAWTVLSYEIYGTIDYWWILCAVNNADDGIFYAPAGKYAYYIKKERLQEVFNTIR